MTTENLESASRLTAPLEVRRPGPEAAVPGRTVPPVEVIAPTDKQRYFNITFMDAFTDNFAGIGTRLTGGRGGRFWVVGPQWQGAAPADVTVLQSSTSDVWMLARPSP